MNQRYKLAPWKTSYESSCLYSSPTELEDNSGWWNTLQSELQAWCSHSQWARYYRTHNYSQPLNLPCRQLDWRPLTGLLYSGRLLSLSAQRDGVGGLPVTPTRGFLRYPVCVESDGNLRTWADWIDRNFCWCEKKCEILSKWMTLRLSIPHQIQQILLPLRATFQLNYTAWSQIYRQNAGRNEGRDTSTWETSNMSFNSSSSVRSQEEQVRVWRKMRDLSVFLSWYI